MSSGWYFGDCLPSKQELARRAAWVRHYQAKGCSEEKARTCADRKHHTWPPK